MKVLIAHNRYRSDQPSGENMVVDAEIDLLRREGVEVVPFIRSSDEIASMGAMDKLDVALGPIRSRSGVRQFKQLLAEHRPDVVHVHNVYPLLSPQIVREAKSQGIPVVMTVHNFRLDCVAGTYFRDGQVCTECSGRSFATPALAHGCYRGSQSQSLPMVLGRSLNRSTWQDVDRFLALTSFHAEFLERIGIRRERIVIRPTSAPDPGEPTPPGRDVLFLGRLDETKGVEVLLEAWSRSSAAQSGRRLIIAGSGPLAADIQRAAERDPSIAFHGPVDRDGAQALMRQCGVVAIPSVWFEGLPRVLVEAYAAGRAVIASDIGGLGAVHGPDAGWLTEPGDAPGLGEALSDLDDDEMTARGAGARTRFVRELDEHTTTHQLVRVYREVGNA